MQPPTVTNSTNTKIYLTPEHRTRLGQVFNDLDDDQLRALLTSYLPDLSITHQFQHFTRKQLFDQCVHLIDNYYSTELEQTIYVMRRKHFPSEYYQPSQQQNFSGPFNQQPPYSYNPPSYRFPSAPTISQQLRSIRPNLNSSQPNNIQHPTRPIPSHPSPYFNSQQPIRPLPSNTPIPNSSSSSNIQRYQVPIRPPAPPPPSSSSSQPLLPNLNSSQRLPINKIYYKNLPFYWLITCVHERYYIFHYDQYRKQYMSHDEFTLSFDVCNQLALSYDFDPVSNTHKTSKSLILRLARIDQPPTCNGNYEDNLPPNLVIHVNGHTLTNLPIPKACTRQQNDLVRTGREIDITSHCMFNPILKNEIKIAWSYRSDNTALHVQYANAQYALHVFLVEHLTVEALSAQVKKKATRFLRDDLAKLVAKARAHDRDLGLEVSDQKLKLTCPIDQRRIKIPARATTCQHLQCFDLTNYIALNEKSNKWMCPVCNKLALFEDLQIDTYTESILNSIQNENITEITINSDLYWTAVIQSKNIDELTNSELKSKSNSSSNDYILIDDD